MVELVTREEIVVSLVTSVWWPAESVDVRTVVDTDTDTMDPSVASLAWPVAVTPLFESVGKMSEEAL